jgi:hypothetical protein
MAEKKFKCTNYDVCPNPDNIIMESETDYEGGEYYCKCGEHSKLEEIKDKNPAKKWGIIAGIVIVAGLIIWWAVSMFSGSDEQDKIVQEEIETTESLPASNEHSPEPVTNSNELMTGELNKIGDNANYSLPQRHEMVEPVLNKYFSAPAYVKRAGSNGTIVETMTAEEYLFRLSGLITLDRVEVIKTLPADETGKIRELVVQEHHVTSIN